jgi:hypothetical protein
MGTSAGTSSVIQLFPTQATNERDVSHKSESQRSKCTEEIGDHHGE